MLSKTLSIGRKVPLLNGTVVAIKHYAQDNIQNEESIWCYGFRRMRVHHVWKYGSTSQAWGMEQEAESSHLNCKHLADRTT